MSCCAAAIGRVVLVVINVVILLVSIVLMAAGAILRYFVNKVLPYLGSIDASTASVQQDLHIPKLEEVTELPFIKEAGTALLVFGCLLFVISFCACCGACYQFRPLLIVFAVGMAVLVIGQAAVGGLFLSRDSALHDKIRENLADQIKEDYKEDSDSVITFSINMMNFLLDCCGINGWEDFDHSEPVKSCCKSDIMTSSDPQIRLHCKTPPGNLEDTYNKMGCYEKLLDKALSQVTLTAIILALIIGLEVVEIVLAILIIKEASTIGPI